MIIIIIKYPFLLSAPLSLCMTAWPRVACGAPAYRLIRPEWKEFKVKLQFYVTGDFSLTLEIMGMTTH
jgi:hypothetical protein